MVTWYSHDHQCYKLQYRHLNSDERCAKQILEPKKHAVLDVQIYCELHCMSNANYLKRPTVTRFFLG